MRRIAVLFVCLGLLAGCKGELSNSGTPPSTAKNYNNQQNNVEVNPDVLGVGQTGLRRLSREEYDNVLRDLLQDTTRSGSITLPEDAIDPFDNNYETQRASGALVVALETLATEAALRAMEDPARRDAIVGCTPSGPGDEACFREFVRSFGSKALRRSLTDEDVDRYMPLLAFGVEDNNFYTAAALVIQTMLQEPGFVYHIEKGVPVDGRPELYRLTQNEVANKLAFFLWGSMPDDTLRQAVEDGELGTAEQVRAQAERMLQDSRAQERMLRFHAMWFGYHRLNSETPISAAMLEESNALVRRVVFEEKRNYMELFSFNETFINAELATHYGLPQPADPAGAWVDYADSGRGGIFSHGTFLSVASKFGDTSPTQRGKLIRERILCQVVDLPPPDLNVNVDEPPTSEDSNCKKDRYATILEAPGCGACHGQIDPVGFGLEQYDQNGQFRTTDVGEPECVIDGNGTIPGVGDFNGPKQLGEGLVQTGALQPCIVRQVYRFAHGRDTTFDDRESLAELSEQFAASEYKFDQLLLDVVSQEAFAYRQVEVTQ